MSRVNWADFLVIIVVLRSTYMGSQRGFFSELFHIFGTCLAIVLSTFFYVPASGFCNKYLRIPINIADIICFVLIAAIPYLFLKALFGLSQKVIEIKVLPAMDKIGGPLLGFCKGLALCVLIFFVMLLMPVRYVYDSVKTKSALAPLFVKTGAVLYEKSIDALSLPGKGNVKRLFSGVKPIEFEMLRLRKKDNLDEVLK